MKKLRLESHCGGVDDIAYAARLRRGILHSRILCHVQPAGQAYLELPDLFVSELLLDEPCRAGSFWGDGLPRPLSTRYISMMA